MKLVELVRQEASLSLPRFALVAGIAGLSNAMVLAIINKAAEMASGQTYSLRYLMIFLAVVGIYSAAQKSIMITSTVEVEKLLHNVRVRIVDAVRHSDLMSIEKIGESKIYASLSKETQTISQAATVLIMGCQSAILLLFASMYLAWLSLFAFLLFLLFTLIAVSIHFRRMRGLTSELQEALSYENRLFDAVSSMLHGFKEVRMSSARSADLFTDIQDISSTTRDLKTSTRNQLSAHFVFSQTTFFLMIAAIAFLIPQFSDAYSEVVIKATTAILFMIGPITSLIGSIPVFAEANAASENIYKLEDWLAERAHPPARIVAVGPAFNEITLDAVTFKYDDPHAAIPFSVGPIDLTITQGELLFITGGNGSGKSTLLKLITALYPADTGQVKLDGQPVTDPTRDGYRDLFSVIFTDYHLFRRLYGIPDVEPGQVEALLSDLELRGKTALIDREWETLDLSGGQRKRLALLTVLLENKPIFVFDEWAADQDPFFRRRFYEEILPDLKQTGKTIVAATHDDKYFHVADRMITLEEGSIISPNRE